MANLGIITENKTKERDVKQSLGLSFHDYLWPLAFMLSCSMIGLNFPLGYVLVLVVLFNRWKKDKYDFIIAFTIFSGGYELLWPINDLISFYDKLLFLTCIFLMVIYKKNPFEKRIIVWMVLYALYLIFFAYLSDESLRSQFTGIVAWLAIYFFIVPLAAYGTKEFDIKVFFKKLMPYFIIFCCFYIIDGAILNGAVFLPRNAPAVASGKFFTFYDTFMNPLSGIGRIWPQGLYISLLCVFPIVRYYKLDWWHWVVFLLALVVCRTFTLYIALLVCWVVAQPNAITRLKYVGIASVILVFLYFIDSEPIDTFKEGKQSTLRVKSSIEQFTDLVSAKDAEDLAKFGSSRMMLVIPAFELIYNLDRQWIGVGFLSQTETKGSKYRIINDLQMDENERETLITNIEIAPIQAILNVGYLGFIIHCAFFLVLWLMVRGLKYSGFFGNVLLGFIIMGLSGFSGLIYFQGLYLCGLALAAVLLVNRDDLTPEDHKKHIKRLEGLRLR